MERKRTKEQSDFSHVRLTQEVPRSLTSRKIKKKEKERLGGGRDGMPPARLKKKRNPRWCFSVGGFFLEGLGRWEKEGPWDARPVNDHSSSISPAQRERVYERGRRE